ncbi:MAG: PEP-CTERM sorting domain-containing protein [Comamonadaceae bacterium]|nr:PEP-CTERM sorting domain-containing protein [Comamonadaceae bacterium]
MAMKKLLVAGAVAALGASMAGSAHADALAQATLKVTNFKFTSGGSPLDASAFSFLAITDGTTLAAKLNGIQDVTPYTGISIGGGGFAKQTLCSPAGSCPDPFVLQPHPAMGASSTSASELNGVPITGLPDGKGGSYAYGANATTAAFAQVLLNGNGQAQSGLTLNSQISFTLNQASKIGFTFDADQILKAWAGNSFSNATATNSLSFTLNYIDALTGDTVEVFSWTPGAGLGGITGGTVLAASGCNINATAARGMPPGGLNDKSCTGSFSAQEDTLLQAGIVYTLGIGQQSTVNVLSIPEPSSVMLAGLALAGLGFAGLRRRKG